MVGPATHLPLGPCPSRLEKLTPTAQLRPLCPNNLGLLLGAKKRRKRKPSQQPHRPHASAADPTKSCLCTPATTWKTLMVSSDQLRERWGQRIQRIKRQVRRKEKGVFWKALRKGSVCANSSPYRCWSPRAETLGSWCRQLAPSKPNWKTPVTSYLLDSS